MKLVVNLIVGLIAAGACAFVSMQMNKPIENEVQVAPDDEATQQRARPVDPGIDPDTDLPVAVRPKPSSPEGIFRIVTQFKQREDSLKAREQTLADKENRLKLLMRDIRTEQSAIDGLKSQVEQRIQTAESLLTKLNSEREEWKNDQTRQQAELQKFETAQATMDDSESRNIKKWSGILQGVEATKAAEYLKEMANDGKLPLAVQILSNFEARDASKILSEIGDASLVVQFTEEFRRLKTTQAKGKANAKR